MSDQQAELLPCPFCGARDEKLVVAHTRATDAFSFWSVECTGCGVEIADDASQGDAREHWNTRATPKSSEGELLDEALTALQAMLDDWGGFRDVNGEEAASALAAKAVLAKTGAGHA